MTLDTVNQVGGAIITGLTAAGTNQATALQLANRTSLQEIATVAASTGVILPAPKWPGTSITITNQGVSTLSIYPQVGGSIDNGTANAAVTLAAGKVASFEASSLTNWYTVAITATSAGGVTSVAAGTGLAGGTITTTGTVSLATIADKSVLGNTSGGTAAPAGVTLSAMIDEAIGTTQGDILYRDSATWQVLAPGTSGKVLQSGGAAANPSWVTNSSGITSLTGDVTTASGSGAQAAFFSGQTGLISPASFSTERDNWSPTGWLSTGVQAANCIRFTATAYVDITGLAAPTSGNLEGVIVTLENAAGTSNMPVRLVASSGSSSAGNQFFFASNVFLAPGESLTIKYDNTQAGWREITSHRDFQAGYFGSGLDGPLAISSGTTTLLRDMYYTKLTISGTALLNPNGFRIFVSEMLDISGAPAGAIVGSLGVGGNGAAGGGAGAAGARSFGTVTNGPLPTVGVIGGTGTATNGNVGTAGSSLTPSVLTQSAGNGGAGGTGTGGTAGTGGTGYTATPSTLFAAYGYSTSPYVFINGTAVNYVYLAPGAGAGGGGSGDSSVLGGGGGGSGASGQLIWIAARFINRGSSSTAAIIQCRGSAGGNGGTPATGTAGGGGGGSGGQGGVVNIYYGYLLGSAITGAIDVASGAGGTGGNGSTTGGGGTGGYAGAAGRVALMNLPTGAFSDLNGGGARAAGTGPTGATGGAGHAAVSYQVNL